MPNRNTEAKTASDSESPWPNERIGAVHRGGNGSDPSASVGLADAVQALSVEGVGAEAIREERREESKEKEASCWEVHGSGEEDQPNFEPQVEKTSKRLAAKAPSAWRAT